MLGIYGDGSDGAINVNATPFSGAGGRIVANVLQCDINATTLTLSAGNLYTNGFHVRADVEVILSGFHIRPVETVGVGVSGAVDGAGGFNNITGPLKSGSGQNGGTGGTNDNGTGPGSFPPYVWNNLSNPPSGAAGGNAGVNTGGAGGSPSTDMGDHPPRGAFFKTLADVLGLFTKAVGRAESGNDLANTVGSAAGGGGASNNVGATGGGGGGGGAAGGWVVVAARKISGTGDLSAPGGNGGAGGNGTNGGAGAAGGGGGGNGGNGGAVILVTNDAAGWSGSALVAGGTGGAGGTGIATGANGANGSNGNTGQTLVIDL